MGIYRVKILKLLNDGTPLLDDGIEDTVLCANLSRDVEILPPDTIFDWIYPQMIDMERFGNCDFKVTIFKLTNQSVFIGDKEHDVWSGPKTYYYNVKGVHETTEIKPVELKKRYPRLQERPIEMLGGS